MKKRDIILILCLVCLSLAGFALIPSENGSFATVYVSGRIAGSFPLSEDRDIHLTGENNISCDVRIKDNSVYMKEASCPNRLCVKSGRICRNNESICCAPAKVLIIVSSDEETDHDEITK